MTWDPELLGVNVTEHAPAVSVQGLGDPKEPVPDDEKVTVPVGVPLELVTVAVQVVMAPALTVPGVQTTVVVEDPGIDTVA